MRRRFQFSVGRMMSALGIFALALWLVRVAIDSHSTGLQLAALLGVPIILAAAVGRLVGNAIGGVVVAALAYWIVAMLAIGIGAIAELATRSL